MTSLPIVDRELRVTSRRSGFYWLRTLLALVAGLAGYDLLGRYLSATSPNLSAVIGTPVPIVTGTDLLRELSRVVFWAALLMSLLGVGSINREKREGTLGLLLLTDLTPAQIVLGKMVSCGLTALVALLGFTPALMLSVLAGGVSGIEVVLSGLGLLTAAFVSIAAGLWMSAWFRERRHAVPATLALVGVLAFGAELLGGGWLGARAVPWLRLLSLGGWRTASQLGLLALPVFAWWLALTGALGWLFVVLAAKCVASRWQDSPNPHVREAELPDDWSSVDVISKSDEPRVARSSWLTNPRPWDADPMRWRVERLGELQPAVWLGCAAGLFAQFGLLGTAFSGSRAMSSSYGLLSFAGLLWLTGANALLAYAGARFFVQARREHDLEMLLTTPVGGRTATASQWRVLRRAVALPAGVLGALVLPVGAALAGNWASYSREELNLLLHPLLIVVNAAAELLALYAVGMWCGLRARTVLTAVVWTVGVVQIGPLALTGVVVVAWMWLTEAGTAPLHAGVLPAATIVVVFLLVKNTGLLLWAWLSLRTELRVGSWWPRGGASKPPARVPMARS